MHLVLPDDAVDVLEGLEPQKKHDILSRLDPRSVGELRLLLSYPQDEMGSYMTTNYVCIRQGLTVRQAMSQLVAQAGDHDNIMTIYVTDQESRLIGAIDLKDLITAREGDDLMSITVGGYPHVQDHDKISDCISKIKDYAEDSIPVFSQEGRILGVITAEDLVEMVDEEMGEDYAWAAAFSVSGCVSISLLTAMMVSSLVGTLIPMFFHKINVDPAVASGPLITTVNDLVAVVAYYGLAYLFLIP